MGFSGWRNNGDKDEVRAGMSCFGGASSKTRPHMRKIDDTSSSVVRRSLNKRTSKLGETRRSRGYQHGEYLRSIGFPGFLEKKSEDR